MASPCGLAARRCIGAQVAIGARLPGEARRARLAELRESLAEARQKTKELEANGAAALQVRAGSCDESLMRAWNRAGGRAAGRGCAAAASRR